MRRTISLLIFSLFFLASCTSGTPEKVSVADSSLPTVTVTATASPMSETPLDAAEAPLTASLDEIIGSVFARANSGEVFASVSNGFVLEPMGQVETKSNSKVRLDLSDDTLVRLGENSLFTLDYPKQEPDGLLTRLQLEFGKIWVILHGGAVEVETSSGVAAVRGSYMSVEYDPDSGEMKITCLEGNCSLRNEHGMVEITAGQSAFILNAGVAPQTGFMSEEEIQEWLDENPEAQILVPYLTEIALTLTPKVTATFTPVPTATKSGYTHEPDPPVLPDPLPIAPAVTIDAISPGTAVVGQVVNYSVSVQPVGEVPMPTGSVVVQASVGVICTVTLNASGTGSCNGTLPTAGTHNIQAFYTGDSYYGTSYSTSQAYVVTAAGTTTNIDTFLPSSSVVGESVVVYFTVAPTAPGGGIPIGTVTVTTSGASCSAAASAGQCTLQFPNEGVNQTVTADFLGSASYSPSSASPALYTVSQASTTTTIQTFSPNPSQVSIDPVTFEATVDPVAPGSGAPTGSVTFSSTISPSDFCTVSAAPWTCNIVFTIPGHHFVEATYSGDTNFLGSLSVVVSQYVALNTDTYFYDHSGPSGTIGACSQTYSVGAIDVNGLSTVDLEYTINDPGFSSPITAGSLTDNGFGTWELTTSIPAANLDIVYWRFKALDGLSNSTTDGASYNYTSINCP